MEVQVSRHCLESKLKSFLEQECHNQSVGQKTLYLKYIRYFAKKQSPFQAYLIWQ